MGLLTRCSLPPILEDLVASGRVAWGQAEIADDIRVLDGQRFLEVVHLTHSLGSEGLAIAEPQANVLNSASSMTCVSELIPICSLITSPDSGAPTRPVPTFGSSFVSAIGVSAALSVPLRTATLRPIY
jgi:hypothetical protein